MFSFKFQWLVHIFIKPIMYHHKVSNILLILLNNKLEPIVFEKNNSSVLWWHNFRNINDINSLYFVIINKCNFCQLKNMNKILIYVKNHILMFTDIFLVFFTIQKNITYYFFLIWFHQSWKCFLCSWQF